jgi:hypothetical protein
MLETECSLYLCLILDVSKLAQSHLPRLTIMFGVLNIVKGMSLLSNYNFHDKGWVKIIAYVKAASPFQRSRYYIDINRSYLNNFRHHSHHIFYEEQDYYFITLEAKCSVINVNSSFNIQKHILRGSSVYFVKATD